MNRHLLVGSFALTLTLGLASGCAAHPGDQEGEPSISALSTSELAREYRGKVAGLDVMARFEVDAAGLVTGSYFYVGHTTKGETIALKGTANGGRIELEESVGGQKTGSFSGTVSNGRISGDWQRADGSHASPFSLDAIAPGKPFTVTRKISATAPAVDPSTYPFHCSLDATYLDVFGMTNVSGEGAINAALTPAPIETNADGKCDGASSEESDATQKLLEKDLLVVELKGSEYFAGAAHAIDALRWQNISLRTGKDLAASDVFEPGTRPTIADLLVENIQLRPDLEGSEKDIFLDIVRGDFSKDEGLNDIDFQTSKDGIVISLFNWLPHAGQALDSDGTLLPWREVRPLLIPGTEVTEVAELTR